MTSFFTFFRRAMVRPSHSVSQLMLGIGLLLLSVASQAQTTRYVSTTGTSPASGAITWATSTTDLQGAITTSNAGDQVWVAGGLYGPITMKSGVGIYGGFAGGESSLNLRPGVNPTAGQPSSSTLSGNNSSTVVRIIQASAATRLDGFVITNGNGSNGGGINNDGIGSSSNPTLVNLLITGNGTSNGGGLYNTGVGYGSAQPTLTNIVFSQNSADVGGGIYNDGQYGVASPILTNVLFYRNSAVRGGAIYNTGPSNGTCDPVLTNVSFQGNSASDSGGAIYNQGAGGNSESRSKLTNASFQGNSASSGAAVYNTGTGAEVTLTSAVIFGNDGSNTFAGDGITVRYSLLDSSISASTYTGSSNLTTTISPFVNSTDLRLNACSAAINAGRWDAYSSVNGPNTDLAGQPRFYNNGPIDMGAFEYQGPVCQPIAITTQPPSTSSVTTGSIVTATVSVTGSSPTYQWFKGSTALNSPASATTASLTLSNVQLSEVGSYSVVISNSCNSVTSTAFSLSVNAPTQPIRYVRQGGSGTADGTNWDNASPDLQSQIDIAGAQQVWVAAGTYKPTSTTGSGSNRISFSMKSGVAIYGGFRGQETDLTQRPEMNPLIGNPISSTLSGDIGVPGYKTDNSQVVIQNSGLNSTARLDGFVISDGNSQLDGGGMLNDSSRPTLVNCIFSQNSAGQSGGNAGGGMYNRNSTPNLTNCIFTQNTASSGGGMYNVNSSPSLTNCSFSQNWANDGGGVHNRNSSPTLTNCSFSLNSANDGGGMSNNLDSSPTLVNCSFSQNSARTGGGILNYGSSYPSLTNCVLFGNGGSNTISNYQSTVLATYSLLEASVTDYTGSNNLTTATSPFASTTSTQLRAGSPAIDAGSNQAYTTANGPTTDLAGNPRLVNTTIDMGAFEFQCATVPARLYVKASATGANTGLSWADAFTDLQSALTFPCSQSLTEVWVAAGVYKPTSTTARDISFSMKNGVTILGGFPANNPTAGLANRNPTSYTTTLSGDVDNDGTLTGNSYHVISNPAGLTTTAVLDGFVITGGNANGNHAAAYNIGGGVYNDRCSPSFSNCTFQGNYAANDGGGMANYNGGNPTLVNCLFSQNQTPGFGGGMYSSGSGNGSLSGASLLNCTFSQNHADGEGGGIMHEGDMISLINCSFLGNSSDQGGGITNFGNRISLTGCTLNGNTGAYGGAINNHGNFTLTNCTISGNNATGSGGGFFNVYGSLNIAGCTISGNRSQYGGGGIYSSITAHLTNSVVFDNGGSNTFDTSYSGSVSASYSLFDASTTGYTATNSLTVTTSPFVSTTDLRLNACAPAINAGDPTSTTATSGTSDLAGNPRLAGRIDMGAYEFQGTPSFPVAFTQQPASGSSVCAGSTVTVAVSVTGTSPAFQWYKDGQVLTGVASATTATLTLTNTQASQSGSYSVVVTGSCPGSVTSTAFNLTVNDPQAPAITTQAGHPYPAGISSLTISQNTEEVILTTTGCAGGTLTWAGGTSTTLAVSTISTGVQTFTATCTLNGCVSPATTATITVVPPSLRVSSRDPENGNLNTNTLKPYLLLENVGNQPISYGQLTVRYWLTLENPAPLLYQINYAQMGNDKVHFTYVPVSPLRQGATGYIEFSFDASAGSLSPGTSAVIQDLINKQDYSMFFQGDDYSYVNNPNFALNPRITAYLNQTILWGEEPAPSGPVVVVPLQLTASASPNTLFTTGSTQLQATASGGTPPYSYTFAGPGSIQTNGNTASVSGLPTGVQTFTVTVTDASQPTPQTVTSTVSVTVTTPVNQTPVASVNPSQTATVGTLFAYTVGAFTDDTPSSLTYSAQISPVNGFIFNSATRLFQGTPQNTGPSSVTITAIDPGGLSASTSFTITVLPRPVVTPLSLTLSASPTALLTTGTTTLSATVSGGTSPYSYAFSGSGTIQTSGVPPTGNTATVSGLPAGVQTFTVVVTDATIPLSQTLTATVSVTVTAPAVLPSGLRISSRDPDNGQLSTNTLKPYLLLENTGNTAIPYGQLTVRYWLTVENPAPLRFDINYAQMGNDKVHLNYVPVSPLRQGATGYIEFSFDGSAGSLTPMSNAVIQDLVNKQDYSYFNQGDDYSYVNTGNFTPNARITGYVSGSLVWGQEPPVATRLSAEPVPASLRVVVLGNPAGSNVRVVVAGAEGQPLRYELTDLSGQVVSQRQVDSAAREEHQTLSLGQHPAGLLFLRISTPNQSQTVKVLKQ